MYPILLQLGDFFLPSWHAFYMLAGLIAWYLLQRQRLQLLPELSSTALDTLFIVSYGLGYIGARVFSILHEGEYQEPGFSWIGSVFQLGSMTLYGGVIAVAAYIFLYARYARLPLEGIADLLIVPSLAAIGVGRIGCFLNGDDYGRVGEGIFTVVFPNLADGLPRYPVQIWETILCWVICLIIIILLRSKKKLKRGNLADVGIIAYCLGRFVLEFWRGDDRGVLPVLPEFFSPAQWLSICFVLLWIALRLRGSRKRLLEA